MKTVGPGRPPRARDQAGVRTILLASVCLLTGAGTGAWWICRTTGRGGVNIQGEAASRTTATLSAGTRAVLQRLDAPIEIRFYALLDPATVPAPVQNLARRVDRLLSAYQNASAGKVKVTRYNSRLDVKAAPAAAADGIKPFNLDKGEACYLGLAVVHHAQRETFPSIAPEWEQALESDLSRVIGRLLDASMPAKSTIAAAPIDLAAVEEVKRRVPAFASLSEEAGMQLLRESALKDFKAAVSEMEVQIEDAEQRFSRTQKGLSGPEQQAALQHLRQVQAEQAEKLKQVAARSAAQIEALRQLKQSAR